MAQSDGTLIFDTKIITDGFKKGLSSLGSVAVKGVGAISAAFATASGAALKFSGELEQNLGGSEAVFKEYAKSIRTAADTAFKNMGLSTSDFLATANKMGALFQGSGFAISESAELSAKTMQRAADVASIMGIDVSMAMESIAGAAKGNFTMMDNLGVAMNDTTLAAYALEKGIKKSTRAMTNQEKISLAMQMFLEKTEYAAGNYAKENETLAGSLTTAKAALENFLSGTGDPKDLADSLSDAAEVIIGKLGELTPKLASGLSEVFADLAPMMPDMVNELISGVLDGASELMGSFGDMFSELVTIAAQSGPDMVDAGIQLVESFADGIVDNADEISAAAIRIGEALISAIIEIVPKIVNAAGKITAAFAEKLGETVPILKPITKVVSFLGDNIEELSGVIMTCMTAFIAWKSAANIITLVQTISVSFSTATAAISANTTAQGINMTALTAKQMIIGILTGKITLATAAQHLWNAALKASPIGLVVAGIAGMIAGFHSLSKYVEKNGDAISRESAKIRELNSELEKQTEKLEEVKASQENAQSAGESQMRYVKKLSNELKELADESGAVQEKDEARAKFILSQLNEALGTEYSMVDGVIQKYDELSHSIDTLIAKKTAEIILSTKEEGFKTALADQGANEDGLNKAKETARALKTEMNEAEEAVKKARQALGEWESTPSNYNRPNSALTSAVATAESNYERAKAAYDKAEQSVEDWRKVVDENEAIINDYWLAQRSILKGNYDAVYNGSYKSAKGVTDGTTQALDNGSTEVESSSINFINSAIKPFGSLPGRISPILGQAGSDGSQSFTKGIHSMIPNTEQALSLLPGIINSALNTSVQGVAVQGSDLILTMQNGMSQTIPDAVSTAENGSLLIINALAVEPSIANQTGANYIDGIIAGMESRRNPLLTTSSSLSTAVDAFFRKPLKMNSPSKVGEENGSFYIKGVENGIVKEAPNLNKASSGSASSMDGAFKAEVGIHSPATVGFDNGVFYIKGVEGGVIDETDNLEDVASKSAKRMNKAFVDAAKFKIDNIRSDISSITGAIAEESEKKKKAYDSELQRIKMLHDFGIDDEETYYKKLEFIRDNYLTKHSDAWVDATQEIYDYQQNILEEQKDLFEDIKDGISDMYDDIAEHAIDKLEEVEKKQSKLAEKLNDSTSLYEKVTINAGDDSMEFYRLNDLSDEKANASAYRDLLNQVVDRVKASGISEDAIAGVLNQIDDSDNDEEGRGFLSALLSADDKTFAQHMNNFAELYATNQGTAVQRYCAEMAEAVDESYQYMIDELTKAGFEIPEGFFVSGTLSAEKFGEAFMSELELQMQEIQTKIIDFNTKLGNSLGVGSQNVNNDNRSTTYNIYGDSKSTVSQIKNYETIKRLSGQ